MCWMQDSRAGFAAFTHSMAMTIGLRARMKRPSRDIAHMHRFHLAAIAAVSAITFMASPAGAVVYCKYVGVPKGCVAKPGVVYKPAPVVRAVPGVGVPGVNTPTNRGGPVNRVGRR